VSASKNRPVWNDLPASVRADIEQLVGGSVVRAQNCPGGFSPGFASRLTGADGRRVFVKAIDVEAWPWDGEHHRAEARTAAALPATIPAPKLLGTRDDRKWTILAFEDIDGRQPHQPWVRADLDQVAAALDRLAEVASPSPIVLPRDHPRLGGWSELACDEHRLMQLPKVSTWAADNLERLIRLEAQGMVVAQGDSLVHFDLYPHNILVAPDRAVFVDWPHARLGASIVDVVMLLSSVSADEIDPDPILHDCAAARSEKAEVVNAILAAHAGFLMLGALSPMPPGLEAIAAAKLHLGLGSLAWLQQRL